MIITILTLFPEMFSGPFNESILKRAQEKKLIEIRFINIRDFGIGTHKQVDDKKFGGGVGMLMRADVVKSAIDKALIKNLSGDRQRIILTSPRGKTWNQEMAKDLSEFDHLIIICGHYEGIDSRIEKFVDDQISIGDFVLTGGEIPSMAIVDSVARLVKGVLKDEATSSESFENELLEEDQYTKPVVFEGSSVPEILLSGDHKKIKEWKMENAIKKTKNVRPDLTKKGT